MTREEGYPRVLIITPTILNHERGGGVTLSRLFAGWPIDSLAQIHADILPPATDICRRYYSVGGPLYRRAASPGARRLMHLLAYLTRTGEHGLMWSRISKRLAAWLGAFRPDVVFSQTGSPGFLDLTERIVAQTRARLVLHASDDWVTDWPASVLGRDVPIAGRWIAARVERRWRAIVARADLVMAISRPMADSYHDRYGRDWAVFGNAIDLASWPLASPRQRRSDQPFSVMYSGSVSSTNQLDGLRDLVAAATRITDPRVEVVISTADPIPSILRAPFVRVVPLAAQPDVPRHLASADALFLPSIFTEPARRFYALSMPGKVAEYLASGRPVVVYAPAGSALARSAARDGWGELVDRPDPVALTNALVRLAGDPTRGAELVQRSGDVARRDHDLGVVRPAFQRAIRGSSGPRRTPRARRACAWPCRAGIRARTAPRHAR